MPQAALIYENTGIQINTFGRKANNILNKTKSSLPGLLIALPLRPKIFSSVLMQKFLLVYKTPSEIYVPCILKLWMLFRAAEWSLPAPLRNACTIWKVLETSHKSSRIKLPFISLFPASPAVGSARKKWKKKSELMLKNILYQREMIKITD